MDIQSDILQRNNNFLNREFRRALIPVMISVLGGTINSLIDSVFVTRRLDSKALVAVTLNMPVFLVLCTVGCLLGGGAFVCASNAIGKNQEDDARKYYHSAVFCTIIISVFFTLAGVICPDSISNLLCDDPEILPLVREYCRITLMGSFAYIIIYIPSFFLQLSGKSKSMTVMMVIMILTDVLFDWLLLYIFDLGITGAGIASAFSIVISFVYGFIRLQSSGGDFVLKFNKMIPFGIKDIMKYGSSQAVGTLYNTFRILALNWIIFKAGGTDAQAVWSVICVMTEVSLCIISGVPRTASPLLGIYIGGHDNEGIRMLMRHQIRAGLHLMVVYCSLLLIFNKMIVDFYKLSDPLFLPTICLAISLLIEVICSIFSSYYNVVGKVFLSNVIMFMRILGFALIFACLLLVTGGYIWLFRPLNMAATLLTTLFITWIESKKSRGTKEELSQVLLLNDDFQKSNKVKGFSVTTSNEMICQASEGIVEFCKENDMDRKTATKLGLAMEEVLTVMVQKSIESQDDNVDARVFSYDGKIGVTIICSGKQYDIFKEAENEDEDFSIGVRMIQKMSKKCHYIYTLGLNVLTIEF